MEGESEIVEADRGFRGTGIARCILLPDQRRVEECGGGCQIAEKAEDVDGREINRESGRRSTAPVEDGLWIEGPAPAEEAVSDISFENQFRKHSRW